MTTRVEISRWFDMTKEMGAHHLIVATDTFAWEDFPVAVMDGTDTAEEVKRLQDAPMSKVMEVYDLNADKGPQMSEQKAWHV